MGLHNKNSKFAASRADHCETTDNAIRDIARILRLLARFLLGTGADPSALRLWDRYYCQGTVKVHYRRHGFPLCHNRREDFYKLANSGRLPPHDMLVTNPPFSGTHIQRALTFCASNGDTPWAVLLPWDVVQRSWWKDIAVKLTRNDKAASPMFIVPQSRYSFDKRRPSGGGSGSQRSRSSADTFASCSIDTAWFLGGLQPEWADYICAHFTSEEFLERDDCVLLRSVSELKSRFGLNHETLASDSSSLISSVLEENVGPARLVKPRRSTTLYNREQMGSAEEKSETEGTGRKSTGKREPERARERQTRRQRRE